MKILILHIYNVAGSVSINVHSNEARIVAHSAHTVILVLIEQENSYFNLARNICLYIILNLVIIFKLNYCCRVG